MLQDSCLLHPGVNDGDPVDRAIEWGRDGGGRVPLICAANERRAGGDWETGVVGYEERLCRRSNLSATLSTPGPDSLVQQHYPIPGGGGIWSENVGMCGLHGSGV
jgi:hypothetical protein